ncbi:S41 family peptidase [Pontibacter sp. G13]|uniref:S41 family peptidase n=1 Tax=Pontibacter sp. G13 TaxID=3074898 RepID=UPI00288ABB30|nr:S41 family peptidase [Pontibacter sp. G13]WNJ20790.1 S41 family peptidase [Pontibacter sp. G13]
MMQRKYLWKGALVGLLFFSVGFVTNIAGDFFEISKNMEIYGNVYSELNKVYVDETNPTELMRTGIDAMLTSLDPYTNYYSESQIEYSKLLSSGQYSGIGAEIRKTDEGYQISELFGGGPADLAGLKVGDMLIKIDSESLDPESLDQDQVMSLLLGEKGSQVAITVTRGSEAIEQTIDVKRGGTEGRQENVPFFKRVDERIGYILLSGFTQDAGKEVAEALQEMKKEAGGLNGVILDLRGNPGGRVDEAVNVVNVFVPANERIVEMRGRTKESQQTFPTRFPAIDPEIPLAVIVNSKSASASEIVSGAIQDLDRGVIVGRRSFGKGLVQNVRPLSYNTQMKITIARYFIPSGRCIQAIDYFHRKEDGTAGRVPDSLFQEYKTRNGRPVFDGGGIYPDVIVEKPALHPATQALVSQNMIFDFATQYSLSHDSIAGPRDFELSDADYDSFVAFAQGKDFAFQTATESQLDVFAKSLEKESYQEALADELAALRDKLNRQKSQDLVERRVEISDLIRKEIVNRYFYKQGVLESGFTFDADIQAALKVLNDPAKYQTTLQTEE